VCLRWLCDSVQLSQNRIGIGFRKELVRRESGMVMQSRDGLWARFFKLTDGADIRFWIGYGFEVLLWEIRPNEADKQQAGRVGNVRNLLVRIMFAKLQPASMSP